MIRSARLPTRFPLLLGCWLLAALPCESAPPNFVIVMADDLGYGDLECYGGKIPTPALNRLAAEGMRFTDFHSSGNVCSPTRAGLLTGRYQRRAGIPGVVYANPNQPSHFTGLRRREVTFAEALAGRGYQTGLVGKWHLGYSRQYNPVHHGFQEFVGYVSGNVDYVSHLDGMSRFDWWDGLQLYRQRGYVTHLITNHSVDFLERHAERPFCLYVAHEAVHFPWQGPSDLPQRGPGAIPQAQVNKPRAFREMLVELDRSVGTLRDRLVQLGIAQDTLFLFFSDNGPDGGSAGPLRGKKGTDWEGGHRVPCIAWWPGRIRAGSRTDTLSITLDVMPTLLELADARVPAVRFDGRSLADVLLSEESKAFTARQLFWNNKAMREGNWKLIRNGKGGPKLGLYDLDEDLGERVNLASQQPERARRMVGALDAWYEDVSRGATH